MAQSLFYDVIEPWLDRLLEPWHRREARRLGVGDVYANNMRTSNGSRPNSGRALYDAVQSTRSAGRRP